MYVPVDVDGLLSVHFALLDHDWQRIIVRFEPFRGLRWNESVPVECDLPGLAIEIPKGLLSGGRGAKVDGDAGWCKVGRRPDEEDKQTTWPSRLHAHDASTPTYRRTASADGAVPPWEPAAISWRVGKVTQRSWAIPCP